ARFAQTGKGRLIGKRAEMTALHRDGHDFPVELTISPVEEGEGPGSFHAFVRDISERRRAEEELRRANEELAHSVNELKNRHAAVSVLNEMGELLQTCNSNDELYEVVARFAQRLFPWGAGSLFMFSSSRDLASEVTRWGESPGDSDGLGLEDCWALRRGRAHVVSRTGAAPRCAHIRGVPFVSFCVPVQSQGEVAGVLYLRDGGPEQQSSLREADLEGALQLALTVSERLGVALTNLTLRQSLRAQSIHDPLTGVFNRRYMEETLDRELQRASRHRIGLGLIMVDIDHFKTYNDRHGHEAGDQILRAVGEFLAVRVRAGDIVCRYGGEEFVLILPDASLEQTIERAEEIVRAVRALEVEFRGLALSSVTISAGVAAYPDHGTGKDSLLRASDRALYRAKEEGRDRVCVAIKAEVAEAGKSWRVVEGGASGAAAGGRSSGRAGKRSR
ncbi:MAG TPA: sensor domain-containing diguanylate cyclase, partial [Actinomycetota bacterium]|nr:sensor domain-containing diguanylate cyclase [Actinomycetota bacterium]